MATMSHVGRARLPDITKHYSVSVRNLTIRTSIDDLYPLFDRFGKVVDISIPRDRRTGESRGFAFVQYKCADEAVMAIERLDGRVFDGRNIRVEFAKSDRKYSTEPIHQERITFSTVKKASRSRSQSPRRPRNDRYARDTYRRSSSRDKNERERYWGREREETYRGGDWEGERGREFMRRGAFRSSCRSRSRSRGRAGEENRLARSASDRSKVPPLISPNEERGSKIWQSRGKRRIVIYESKSETQSQPKVNSWSRSPRKRSDSEEPMKVVDPRVEIRPSLNISGGSESPDRKPSPPHRRLLVSSRARSRSSSPVQSNMFAGQVHRSRSPDAPRSSLSPALSDGA